MTLIPVSPTEAHNLVSAGARLVDVRGRDEYARTHIVGSDNIPLTELHRLDDGPPAGIVFHCKSGARTCANAARLAGAAGTVAYRLEGGLEAWQGAGLPVVTDRRQPIEIMRQVQIAAGLLILAGLVLGLALSDRFLGLSAFVGAGLLFAGATGWCGMARLLAIMPWNRAVS